MNQSVKASGNKRSQVTGIRWYELANVTSGTPTLHQQGTFSPDSNSRWMGSIAMDKVGDIALGYKVSSSAVFPSIAFTGRVPADPLGTLQAENRLKAWRRLATAQPEPLGDYSENEG